MIPFPFQMGQLGLMLPTDAGGGGGGGNVSFIASGSTTYVTATTTAPTIPGTTLAGDLILSWVFCRSALTPPAGWTLVNSTTNTMLGVSQTTALYSKTAVSGDIGATPTWTQATSARMAVHYHVLRGSTGTPTVINSSADYFPSDGFTTWAMLSLGGTAPNQIGIGCINPAGADVGNPISATSPFTLTTPTSDAENRLFVAYRTMGASDSTNGSIVASTAQDRNRLSVVIG